MIRWDHWWGDEGQKLSIEFLQFRHWWLHPSLKINDLSKNDPKPAWVLVSEELIKNGFTVYLHRGRFHKESKYLRVKLGSRSYLIRFSGHHGVRYDIGDPHDFDAGFSHTTQQILDFFLIGPEESGVAPLKLRGSAKVESKRKKRDNKQEKTHKKASSEEIKPSVIQPRISLKEALLWAKMGRNPTAQDLMQTCSGCGRNKGVSYFNYEYGRDRLKIPICAGCKIEMETWEYPESQMIYFLVATKAVGKIGEKTREEKKPWNSSTQFGRSLHELRAGWFTLIGNSKVDKKQWREVVNRSILTFDGGNDGYTGKLMRDSGSGHSEDSSGCLCESGKLRWNYGERVGQTFLRSIPPAPASLRPLVREEISQTWPAGDCSSWRFAPICRSPSLPVPDQGSLEKSLKTSVD